MICFCIAQTWLYKLKFVYKKVCKDVFIDNHKQLDVVEDQNCFLIKIEKLKLYIVEFSKNSVIKAKDYLVNFVVKGKKYCLIIIIIHNKYTFFANSRV